MRTAVLVMAYGTPATAGQVAEFYTDVRRGRAPSDEQLTDLERRYEAIGGVSPLTDRTLAQVDAIQRALDSSHPGSFTVFYGAKHSAPKIEEAIDEIAAQHHTSVVGVVLAPHYSALSVGEYIDRARRRAHERGLRAAFVKRWGAEQILIDALARRVVDAKRAIDDSTSNVEYLFSAHSLPERLLAMGDHYADEVAETARLVAERLGLDHHRTAWQSAGRTPEPWLGPDVLGVLEELSAQGFDGVVVCPAGFTSDHLEVLYDLDIEAHSRAAALGMALSRTRSLNDDPEIARLLARLVTVAAESLDAASARP